MIKSIQKKVLIVTLILCSAQALATNYSGSCGANATYVLNTETGLLKIEGSGIMFDYTPTNKAPWYSYCSSITKTEIFTGITSIGNYAFQQCANLKSIIIPESVTSIGQSAFSHCSALTSVSIPNSVTIIEESMFSGCYSLKSLMIHNTVTRIGREAFKGCSGLTSLTIPSSVTGIGNSAFAYCYFTTENFMNLSRCESSDNWRATLCDSEQEDGLLIKNNIAVRCRPWASGVTFPNFVISIGSRAFVNCHYLSSVTIPSPITSIGQEAFSGCSGLSSLFIGNTVTSIGNYSFSNCKSLKLVKIGNSVTSIGDGAFFCCSGLTSVTIPNSVISIGGEAFEGCSGLTSINIPNSVTSIGGQAFAGCSGLTSVSIPNSVTDIGVGVFASCSNLTKPVYTDKFFIKLPVNHNGSYIIPEVLEVLGGACRNCKNLSSVIIPNSVTRIGGGAFDQCYSLSSLVIGDSVQIIESEAFNRCTTLRSVNIPNSVTNIGSNAFYGCSNLTSATIGKSIVSIGGSVFENCSRLSELTCDAVVPPTIEGNYPFYKVPTNTGTLYVPAESIDAYKNAQYWKDWGTIQLKAGSEIKIESISFSSESIDVMEGTNGKLDFTILPENATNKTLQWISTNPAVLTIDDEGIYTAKSLGYATVMAVSSDGSGCSAMCNVRVVPYVFEFKDFSPNLDLDEPKTYDTMTYTRTLSEEWDALYVPFSLDVTSIADEIEVAEIYNIHQYDANYNNDPNYTVLEIKPMSSGCTDPNMPYLIRAKQAGKKVITMTNATIYPTEVNSLDCSSVQTKFTFTGTYRTRDDASAYTIFDGVMKKGAIVFPSRWYMKATNRKGTAAQLPEKIRIMTMDEVVDGTFEIYTVPDAIIYGLQGYEITTQKGLNIIRYKNGSVIKVIRQ